MLFEFWEGGDSGGEDLVACVDVTTGSDVDSPDIDAISRSLNPWAEGNPKGGVADVRPCPTNPDQWAAVVQHRGEGHGGLQAIVVSSINTGEANVLAEAGYGFVSWTADGLSVFCTRLPTEEALAHVVDWIDVDGTKAMPWLDDASMAQTIVAGKPLSTYAAVGGMPQATPAGLIAFVRDGDIWTVGADGTGQRRLTDRGGCSRPRWAPGGTSLVFGASDDIWQVQLGDEQIGQLTTNGDCFCPTWRPGADEVWFLRMDEMARDGGAPATLWSCNVESGELTQQFDPGNSWERSADAAWRPDGEALLLELAYPEGGEASVWSIDGTRSDWASLAGEWGEGPMVPLSPAWSPTHPNMLATGDNDYMDGTTGLYLLDAETRAWRSLLKTRMPRDASPTWPVWDTSITTEAAVVRFPVWAMRADDQIISAPSWSPDSMHIAFDVMLEAEGYRYGGCSVWIVSADGSGVRMLAADGHSPAWRPVVGQ